MGVLVRYLSDTLGLLQSIFDNIHSGSNNQETDGGFWGQTPLSLLFFFILPKFFLPGAEEANPSFKILNLCNPKMIMSCLVKIEMSGYGSGIIPFFERGRQYGQKGYNQHELERIKEVTYHQESN